MDSLPKLLIWEIPEEHFAPGSGPIDWVDAWARRQYLLELGANLTGDCASNGLLPVASFASDFSGDGSNMKVDSTNAKSFVKYQFAAPIRPDQYLSMRARSASADSFLIESASVKPERYCSRLIGYGRFHRVKVPLARLADGTTRSLIVRTASGSDFALETPKPCTMPAAISELANGKR